ncbi:MAG: hypothetical protein H0T76_23340 [Nannocystis sp.]|nr:hypothetical protein [Nannocystis sp.]MBA3549420.1 hypothetical protein [Nannocystis sp.]
MRLTRTLLALSLAPACSTGEPPGQTAADPTTVTDGVPVTMSATGSSTADAPTEGSATASLTEGQSGGQTDARTDTTDPAITSSGTGTEASTAMTDGQTDSQTDSQTDTGPDDTGSTDTGPVEACPCPELDVALDDGIFVLSKTAQLWKYFPGKNEFTLLGAIDCGLAPSTFSMGVDRQGSAWVQFSDQQIRKIDVTKVSECSDPGFVPGQDGIKNFGMAFVSNSAEDQCDRLYGNHYNFVAEGDQVSEFFSVDPLGLALVQLGKSNYGRAELTGTGDGRAFLFAGPDPSKLVEVDKATGATLDVIPLPGVKTGGGFAFAFFGGDFYFFTDNLSDSKSEVTHLDYDDSDKNGVQDLKVIYEDAPLRIVGAGVSTCAPLVPQ